MRSLEEVAAVVRQVESGGDYNLEQPVRVGGRDDIKVGAYGILLSAWPQLANNIGIPGASWRDPRAQDRVAMSKMSFDADRLGSLDMVPVSWRFGYKVAKELTDRNITTVPAMGKNKDLRPIADYMRSAEESMRATGPISGQIRPPAGQASPPPKTTERTKAEGIIRDRILGMSGRQTAAAPPTEPTPEPEPEFTPEGARNSEDWIADPMPTLRYEATRAV